jgi:hypothetical protein
MILTLLVGLIGAIIDGLIWSYVRDIDVCGDRNTDTFYGNTEYAFTLATTCGGAVSDYGCYCASTTTSTCFVFDLADDSNHNCGDVMGYWSQLLGASTIFCVIIAISGLVFSLVACCVACGNAGRSSHTPQNSIKSDYEMQPVPMSETVHVTLSSQSMEFNESRF